MENNIKELVSQIFEKLDVKIDSIEIKKMQDNIFSIKLETEESGIIIGPHWRNLESIKLILNLMISKLLWEKTRIHIEVNDYMQSRDERLFSFIESKIQIVEKTSKDIKLPFYTAYDRKKIHSYVAEYQNNCIYTKSIWEWRDRRLYICKKDEKLTIDIDWDDI